MYWFHRLGIKEPYRSCKLQKETHRSSDDLGG